MWNPETYRDTDYGLGDGEHFEPMDDLDEEFAPAENEPYIQTMLGPIRPEEAGVTLVQEYLQRSPMPGISQHDDLRLNDTNAALLDLEAFFSASGRTVVSATPSARGRDASWLLWLAQHAPVHIVGATGISLSLLSADGNDAASLSEMLEVVERDVTEGMDGTTSHPGVLTLEIGDRIEAAERAAIDTVARVYRAHDLPIIAGGADSRASLELVDELSTCGIPHSRIIAAPTRGTIAPAVATELAKRGVYTLFSDLSSGSDERTVGSIVELLRAGYRDFILLSHGFDRRSKLTGYGGRPGLGYVVEYFAVMLLEAGLEAQDVRSILVDNAARALSLRQRARGS